MKPLKIATKIAVAVVTSIDSNLEESAVKTKKFDLISGVVFVLCLLVGLFYFAVQGKASEDQVFTDIFEKNKLGVFAVVPRMKGVSGVSQSSGTGFVISAQMIEGNRFHYEVLTNAHVADNIIQDMVENKTTEVLRVDLQTYDIQKTYTDVKVEAVDPIVDLAILSFESTEVYPVLPISNRTKFEFLEPILIVGNTRGDAVTPNRGNIKNPKSGMKAFDFVTFQHDAEATGGNSGSPVFDMQGEVIGVFFRGSDDNLLKFTIPSERVKKSIANMQAHKGSHTVVYGDWGVRFYQLESFERQVLTNSESAQSGVMTANVFVGGAAEAAGLQNHDIILAINGDTSVVDVVNTQELYKFTTLIRDSRQDQSYVVKVYRQEDEKILEFTLKPQEVVFERAQVFTTRDGFSVMGITGVMRQQQGLKKELQGVVAQVPKGSAHSFYTGCVITKVNGIPVKSIEDFKTVWTKFEQDRSVIISYSTGASYYVAYLYGGRDAEGDYVMLR